MNISRLASIIILLGLIVVQGINAEITFVNSQETFDAAHDNSDIGDSIVWRTGIYSDVFMDIENDHLYIAAEELGKTIFTGASRVDITSDYITLKGFQFLDGDIGTKDVINTRGSYNIFTQINIRAYKSYKYLRVREESRYVEISYCNFENRLNLDDQNILSILVDETNPGYHKIQYCSFKNFDGTGNDLGIEPIRIGLSTQADHISRTLVEHCYFAQCNGDGEIISSKASQNVYRYNTFEDNPKAELVLRHGSEAIVYGNFFLNGKGGVRVREGQNHFIYNNYFFELDDRAIYLQNNSSDPLDKISIAFNTVIDCSEIILGGDGSNKPTNVVLANNIFTEPDDQIFEDATGTEVWISNIYSGDPGISIPAVGLSMTDPQLLVNGAGYFGLSQNSPAIDAAHSGYEMLPQFEGIDNIDSDIILDLMKQSRPLNIEEKDLGCSEYPHNIMIQPIATEANTGPDYNTSMITSLHHVSKNTDDLINIQPNPVQDHLNIEVNTDTKTSISFEVFDVEGRSVSIKGNQVILPDSNSISRNISELPPGLYYLHITLHEIVGGEELIKTLKFIKS